jgi:hypothetical protein
MFKAQLQKSEHRFNAAESGMEFLHAELSRTRKHSEDVMEALAVEQSDGAVMRCRVRELEAKLVEYSGHCVTNIEDEYALNESDKDFYNDAAFEPRTRYSLDTTPYSKVMDTPYSKVDVSATPYSKADVSATPYSKADVSAELGSLRKELRDSRGGEPLSDVTGAWQRVQALEARVAFHQDAIQKSPDIIKNAQASPVYDSPEGKLSRQSHCRSSDPKSRNSGPFASFRSHVIATNVLLPEPSPSGVSRRSSASGPATSGEPNALIASPSSSTVTTCLSACMSPVTWPVPGTRECSRSPELCDMGLEGFGARSLECSFGIQSHGMLALPASPSPNAEPNGLRPQGLRF